MEWIQKNWFKLIITAALLISAVTIYRYFSFRQKLETFDYCKKYNNSLLENYKERYAKCLRGDY